MLSDKHTAYINAMIGTLQRFGEYAKGKGISYPGILREAADFAEFDVPRLLEQLEEIRDASALAETACRCGQSCRTPHTEYI